MPFGIRINTNRSKDETMATQGNITASGPLLASAVAPTVPEGWRATWVPYDRQYSYLHIASGYVQWGYPDESKISELSSSSNNVTPLISPPPPQATPLSLQPPPYKSSSTSTLPQFENPGHWSGRGQHVEFSRNETIPLQEVASLGRGATADVHEVRCQGVRIARKQIYCSRRMKIEDVKRELEILRKIDHRHIITLVGSYTQRNVLGLLLYPAAACDLGMFLDDLDEEQRLAAEEPSWTMGEGLTKLFERLNLTTLGQGRLNLFKAFGCLANAIQYLHDSDIRHKDLKPRNILLDQGANLYVTDFGLSRDTTDASTSVTNGIERGTYKYCAPEVAKYEPRGRAADVYSLGCVFLEMLTVARQLSLVEFENSRSESEDHSFQNSPQKLREWITKLRAARDDELESTGVFDLVDLVEKMVSEDPAQRPIIKTVVSSIRIIGSQIYNRPCCSSMEDDDYTKLAFKYKQVKRMYFEKQAEMEALQAKLASFQTSSQ